VPSSMRSNVIVKDKEPHNATYPATVPGQVIRQTVLELACNSR
jgi:hypothetical protein